MENAYSRLWFDLFMAPVASAGARTEQEITFLQRQLPHPEFNRILDLCCGVGRHADMLAKRGYAVVGLDRDRDILQQARAQTNSSITYLQGDMRNLQDMPGDFDAVLNLWQSFGYFDDDTNVAVLRQISGKLRRGGRFILDVYHREYFERHQGKRVFEKDNVVVTERREMRGNRLRVDLDYGGSRGRDSFDWRLYTPDELRTIAQEMNLQLMVRCAQFEENHAVTPQEARMQLVFQRSD